MLSVLSRHLLNDVSGFPNRQAELNVQTFPNGVWEREIFFRLNCGNYEN
jgi:hypothetical protein